MLRPRSHGRSPRQIRPVTIVPHYVKQAEGSALVQMGDTWVLCSASVEERVPPHVLGTGSGWVTAEYGMLPRATAVRTPREAAKGRQGGRTFEIQRLIGRALRMAVDLDALGERTVTLDCDVLQADGGTRTASITGGWVALALACRRLHEGGYLRRSPLRAPVAAVSVGVVGGELLVDLDYFEDSRADVDLNVVASDGELIEVQGTAEQRPFSRGRLVEMVDAGLEAIAELVEHQRRAAAGPLPAASP